MLSSAFLSVFGFSFEKGGIFCACVFFFVVVLFVDVELTHDRKDVVIVDLLRLILD